MIGLGLLAAVPASDILTGEDPDDADGDGVSGRAQVVGSFEHDRPMIGRFGWRAGAPTAIAFASDISLLIFGGVGVCAEAQTDCRQAPHGDGDARGQEIGAEGLNLVTFYSRNLAVPARRDLDDPEVWAARSPFARPAAPRVIPQVRRGWRGSPSSAFS